MLCPNCRTEYMADDIYCQNCGTDLTLTSKSLVTTQTRIPALIQNAQLPRVAASIGAIALGVGLELLRRRLIARVTSLPRSAPNYVSLPSVDAIQELFSNQGNQSLKLPKGYEIHETAVYFRRVIRREA